MRLRRSAARPVLLTLALAVTLTFTSGSAQAGDGWWGGLDEGEAVSLADIMRGPRAYRDRIITFYCVFHTADGEFKYYPPNTAFSEQRHLNFSVWPDGAPMWEERSFRNDVPFLYLRRTNAQRAELVRLPGFTRLEVTGKIRDIVREKPAIEVFSFRQTGHRFGKPIWKRIMQGRNYARAGTTQGYQLAARAFKDALQPDLPPVYDMQVRKLLADTLRKLGFHDEARAYENGESVGMPKLPKPDPGANLPEAPTFPDDLPQPFSSNAASKPTPTAPRPTGPAPAPFGSPDGEPSPVRPPQDLPPTGTLPPAPLGPDEALPPAGPGASPSGFPAPAPRGGPRPVKPPVAKKPSVPPPNPSARGGIPPKRRVRLTGVK